MEKNLLFLNLKKNESSELLISQCSAIYCQIWKEEPWDEDFWTIDVVSSKIKNDIKILGSECFVSVEVSEENSMVNGFTWGYLLDYEKIKKISDKPSFLKHFESLKNVFYVAELGVESESRSFGIGKTLSKILIKKVIENDYDCLILRTDVKANVARSLYIKLGFKELPVHDSEFKDRSYWVMTLK